MANGYVALSPRWSLPLFLKRLQQPFRHEVETAFKPLDEHISSIESFYMLATLSCVLGRRECEDRIVGVTRSFQHSAAHSNFQSRALHAGVYARACSPGLLRIAVTPGVALSPPSPMEHDGRLR